MKKILIAVYLYSTAFFVQAGGFQVNTQSQKALGMGGAFSASHKEASAAYFNPGALAMLDSGRFISLGATFLLPKTTFLSENTFTSVETESQPFFPSYFYAAVPLNQKLCAGLSINSPYGLGTKWDDNWEGRAVSQEASLKTVYIQPTLSYRITENFSAGAGLVYAYGNVLVRRQIGEINSNVKLTGSTNGLGFNAGIFGKIQEEVSFGITYRSSVNFDLDNGKASFNNVPANLAAQFPEQNFTSSLTLPSTLSVGFTNRINQKVLVAFEFNLTGWSSYDSLNFDFENAATPDSKAGRKYEDAMAFRIGAEYTHNDHLTFRAGGFYDETPVRDEYITPDLPDGSRIGLTTGLSYKISDRFELDAAYLFEKVADRNAVADIRNTKVANVAGQYRTYVNGIGLGLNLKF